MWHLLLLQPTQRPCPAPPSTTACTWRSLPPWTTAHQSSWSAPCGSPGVSPPGHRGPAPRTYTAVANARASPLAPNASCPAWCRVTSASERWGSSWGRSPARATTSGRCDPASEQWLAGWDGFTRGLLVQRSRQSRKRRSQSDHQQRWRSKRNSRSSDSNV